MANAITLVTKFLPILDAIYKQESKSARFDAGPGLVLPTQDANTIKIAKIAMQGLVNYARETGFTRGDITLDWETMTFSNDRGRTFHIDSQDNEETLGIIMASVVGEFIRSRVVPEIDAYRFAKYAGTATIDKVSAGAALDKTTVVAAIDLAQTSMDNNEVPEEGRVLLVSPAVYAALKAANDGKHILTPGQSENRNFMMYDNMEIVKVPQSRFYTAITLATSGDGGYAKGGTAKDINFMIIHPSAVLQVTKHVVPRMFEPAVNQAADAWKVDYRVYHDAFVYEQKAKGIYLHMGA